MLIPDSDFSSFREAMHLTKVIADPEPGRIAMFFTPSERKKVTRRRVIVESANRVRFSVEVPLDMTHSLRTMGREAAAMHHANLAKIFARVFYATVPWEFFRDASFAKDLGSYEEHMDRMRRDGSVKLAQDLYAGLGADAFNRLLEAAVTDMFPQFASRVRLQTEPGHLSERPVENVHAPRTVLAPAT